MRFLDEGHPHQAAMLLSRARLMEPEKASIREALARADRIVENAVNKVEADDIKAAAKEAQDAG